MKEIGEIVKKARKRNYILLYIIILSTIVRDRT